MLLKVCFILKKKLLMTIFFLYGRFLVSNQNFTTSHEKILEITGFLAYNIKFQILWQVCLNICVDT